MAELLKTKFKSKELKVKLMLNMHSSDIHQNMQHDNISVFPAGFCYSKWAKKKKKSGLNITVKKKYLDYDLH